MTTTFYTSWQTKTTKGYKRWYASKEYITEAETRAVYEKKMEQTNVREAILWKKVHYEPSELASTYVANHPWGHDAFDQLRAYSRI